MSKPDKTTANVSFSHIQFYVDKVEDLQCYKHLEQQLNTLESTLHSASSLHEVDDLTKKQELWQQMSASTSPVEYTSYGRDIVKQLLVGLGFRVTRCSKLSSETRSLVVTSKDPRGIQFIVTAPVRKGSSYWESPCGLFTQERYRRFVDAHNGRMGIAVLSFFVDDLDAVKDRYETIHPKLMDSYHELAGNVKILEVFAYYKANGENSEKMADPGTVLRFIQYTSDDVLYASMGFETVDAVFSAKSQSAYSDHWVSNVFSRTDFLETLEHTLGFSPKVDFNAGVVAAGEAQIESTVTGNTAKLLETADSKRVLRDQSQVYLPINNAISSVGHVYGFLQELGQGIQHVASRVEDIVSLIENANEMREITSEGLTFLKIPRSYYGILTSEDVTKAVSDHANRDLNEDFGIEVIKSLSLSRMLSNDGAVDLSLAKEDIDRKLEQLLTGAFLDTYRQNKDSILRNICFSRFKNIYSLMGDNISESTYLAIVRNQILVDVQGDDLLYQIFTSKITVRNAYDEAPFLEFIQRVCSERKDSKGCPTKIRPGCGGFGIRNFLTLFLSIEVSKAMYEVAEAKAAGDEKREKYAQAMVDCFTRQLDDSNPILTEISNAMTDEGRCRDMLLTSDGDDLASQEWQQKATEAAKRKQAASIRLMECSSFYNAMMRTMREQRHQGDL